jgi:TDG/mug DNA glycosylase family protein
LAATLKPKEKEEIWKELGDWAVQRRVERAAAATAVDAAVGSTALAVGAD